MSTQASSPTWLDRALTYSAARIRENLSNLERFPERTEVGQWLCVEKTGWWVDGHWVGLIYGDYYFVEGLLKCGDENFADSL